jgi:hypothetical protein
MKYTVNLIITSVLILVFSGCASYEARNGTSRQRALAAIQDAETGIRYTIGPAITTWLLMQKDLVQRGKDAQMVYSAAQAMYSLATGGVPTPDNVKSTILSFVGNKSDPRYQELADDMLASFGPIWQSFQLANTSPAKFLTECSQNAELAAKPYLPVAPIPTPAS